MNATSGITNDHKVIRKWAGERNGGRSQIIDTRKETDDGSNAFTFGGIVTEKISMRSAGMFFFREFDENKRDLLYQGNKRTEKRAPFTSW